MDQKLGVKLLLAITQVLSGKFVETSALSQALALVCREFSFEESLLYEMESEGQLSLAAWYREDARAIPTNFSLEQLVPKKMPPIPRGDFFWIWKNPDNPPFFQQLFSLYTANRALFVPTVDENGLLHGFLLFLPGAGQESPPKEDELLSAAISLLLHCARERIYQRRLSQSRVALGKILDNTGIDIYVNDFNTHDILYVNQSMAAPYGGKDAFTGKKCWQVLFPGQSGPCEFCPEHKLLDEQGIPSKIYSWDYQRSLDGSWFRVFSAAFYWEDGRLAHVVSSADITDNKRNEALVENLANYDQLTKLPNRRMLLHECERRIKMATSTENCYLLFFDIDGFKSINDTLGHDAGDEFLIQLGEFFTSIPLLKNAIYRNGGDEFVAVIGGEDITKEHISNLAGLIHRRFQSAWLLKNGEVHCGASLGVACYPEDGRTPEILLQKADQAMYLVKKNGGNGILFGYQLPQ